MAFFYSKRFISSVKALRLALIFSAVLLAAMILSPTSAHAETQHKTVTISLQNTGYGKVFEEITRQTGYTFLYNNVQLDRNARVSIDMKDHPTTEVLEKLFSGTGISYSMVGNQIVITRTQATKIDAEKYDIRIRVTDKKTQEPIIGSTCHITNLGIYGITDNTGTVLLKSVAAGENEIEIRMLGYKTINSTITTGPSTDFAFQMTEVSLAMDNVTVTGTRTVNSLSSSVTIDRQAIDHIQAVSLYDLLELLPGQALRSGKTMTNTEQLSFRTLQTDANNSFGAAVFIDGMQLSNNATLEGQTEGLSSTVGGSIDLRAIGTDDIESVEVILGVPSAEYGDLTSGAMIVKTNVGYSPLRIRGKINPGIKQASVGKGWRVGEKNSVLNMNFDYTRAAGDPRQKSLSLDRINASAGAGIRFADNWNTNTRFRMASLIDWRGTDPDVADSGTDSKSKNFNYSLSHDGTISFNKLFSRTVSYNFGVQYSEIDQYQTKIITTGQSIYSLYNSTETGYHEAVLLPSSYVGSGGTKSKPFTFSAKVTNQFYVRSGGLNQRFNMGADYRFEKNHGIGNYNDDNSRPLQRTATRERSFKDIPALNQLAAFLEDNIEFKLFDRPFKAQAGVRFTALQPGKDEFVYGFSPRVNVHYQPTDKLTLRGSFGKTEKTPGMTHLYPDKIYNDHRIAAYLPNQTEEQMVVYHTRVIDVAYNENLKNSRATRWGAGLDLKLSNDIIFSVDAYRDYNPNGFEGSPAYTGYYLQTYDVGKGITPVAGQKPTLDFLDPNYTGEFDKEGIVYASLGLTGNTAHALNQGIEFSFDLGRIKPINTSVFLSGAYMESKTWSDSRTFSNPVGGTNSLGTTDSPRFKLEHLSGQQKYLNKLFRSNLRLVCNIPKLQMVASAAFQMTWWTYAKTLDSRYAPIGYFKYEYVNGQVVENYYNITDEMIADNDYRLDNANGDGILLRDQLIKAVTDKAVIQPPLFLFNFRLTKKFSDVAGFSFYANNTTFYQPWQHNNTTTTLSERNPDLEFGFELSFSF